MQQVTPEQQIEQLNGQIKDLKVRTFDLQEALNGERAHVSQFVNILAQQLGLEGEEAQDLQNYINKVNELKEKLAAYEPVEGEAEGE